MPKFDQIIQKENALIATDSDFKIIKEQALELKKQHDETIEPLNFQKFEDEEKSIQAKSKRFEELTKKESGLKIHSLAIDDKDLKGDSASIARNAKWIKGLSKDIDLKKTVEVFDMMSTLK